MSQLDIKLPAHVLHKRRQVGPGRFLVAPQNPVTHHKLVEKFARYFNRETRWGLLYNAVENEADTQRREAWLFINDSYEPCGACCFRKRTYKSGAQRWHLHWIWLHPYERNKGLLKRALPAFTARYGEWVVEGPYSRTMQLFMDKNPQLDSYTNTPLLPPPSTMDFEDYLTALDHSEQVQISRDYATVGNPGLAGWKSCKKHRQEGEKRTPDSK